MIKILCFGDSNTYGFIPQTGKRYEYSSRWCGILQKLCGDNYQVIEAGCNNRTAFSENPAGDMFIGTKILPQLLNSDLDYVVLSVGINDLQTAYNNDIKDVEAGVEELVKKVTQKLPKTVIILVCPSALGESVLKSPIFSTLFDETSIKKSFLLSDVYSKIAEKYNCIFLNLDLKTVVSDIDGLHYDKSQHEIIAEEIFEIINV